jgi:YggT family protein
MPNYFLISLISNAFQIMNILIIIRVLLSWFNYNAQNQYIRLLYKITEPILAPIRNLLSSFNMGIDISPLIAIFALSFIRNLLIRLLVQI